MKNLLWLILFGFLLGWMFLLDSNESEEYGYGL
jgi:hypothetical protein